MGRLKVRNTILDKSKKETLTFEIRNLGTGNEGERKIVGYAAIFDSPSENLGGFVERIKKGAFTETLKEKRSDPLAFFNHDSSMVLGRRSAGTLVLSEDEKGLNFEISPPDTQWARDLIVSMDRGDIRQMSFGFRTIKDAWSDIDKPIAKRELLEVALQEISVVSMPAYKATSAKLRDIEGAEMLSEENIKKVETYIRTLGEAPAAEAAPPVVPAVEAVNSEWIRACMDADCLIAGIPIGK
jgi:HK97 family phage prohead protease